MNITEVIKIEKKLLFKDGDLSTKIVFVEENGLHMIPLPFRNSSEKEYMRRQSMKLIHLLNVKKYWFISTAWVTIQSKKDIGKQLYRQPSRDINKKEAFLVMEFNIDSRENIMAFYMIERNNKKITLKESKLIKGMKMDSYWDAWADIEKLDKQSNEMIEENDKAFLSKTIEETIKKYRDKIYGSKSEEEFLNILKEMEDNISNKIKDQNKTLLESQDEII
jgi:hypothetical protein